MRACSESAPEIAPVVEIAVTGEPAEAFSRRQGLTAPARGTLRQINRWPVPRRIQFADPPDRLPPLRRKSVDQGQPIEAFAEPAREIIDPALAAQSAPLPDLLHGHAQNQDLMHQRRAIGAELALDPVQPQYRLALAFRDRIPLLAAIDIFPGGIDGLRSAL